MKSRAMKKNTESNKTKKRNLLNVEIQCNKRHKLMNYKSLELHAHEITLWLIGNIEAAGKSFILALQCHESMDSENFTQNEMIECSNACSVAREGLGDNWEQILQLSTSLQISSILDANPTNIQIQCEFDDGMCPESDVMAWDEHYLSTNHSIMTAILAYNIGQTHRRRKNFKEAQKWFRVSITYLKQTTPKQFTEEKIEIMVQSLQILGVMKYRDRQYGDAVKCYEKALTYLTTQSYNFHHKNNRLLDITKNALALTLFYSSVEYGKFLHVSNTKNHRAIKDISIMTFFEERIEIYRQLSGNYQRDIATVLNNMGRVHYLRGNYTPAMQRYEAALKIRRKIYPIDSIDLAVSVLNLGKTYHQLGLNDDAIGLLQEFLDLMKYHKVNRTSHYHIGIVMACIGTIYYERGELNESRKMYEKALCSTKLADDSCTCQSQKASILNKLGSICYKMKDLSLALEYLTEGLNTEVILYGMNHPNVVITLLNIAQIHRDQSDFSKALLRYNEVYSIQIAMDGQITHSVATTLFSMGLMLYHMKKFTLAFDKYQDALLIQRKLYEKDLDNEDIASTLNSIGIVLFHLGKVEMAKKYFQESLRIRKKVLGSVHQDVATNLYNLATLHLQLGNDLTAIHMFKETLEIERQIKDFQGQSFTQTLNHLGLLYQRNGDFSEALKYFELSLGIERSQMCHNQVEVGRLLNLIGNIHLQNGNVAEMMSCFIEASRIYDDFKKSTKYKNKTNMIGNKSDKLVIIGISMYELNKLHPKCAKVA